jgi:hypothetical protein
MGSRIKEELAYTTRILKEENRKGKISTSELLITAIASVTAIGVGYLLSDFLNKRKDSDGDGIPDYKEKEYGTDPNKPNYLLGYALKKLPENEALKFKNVENFNESSKGLVDLYASLPPEKRNSKEVSDLLNQILLDNKINELEKICLTISLSIQLCPQ